MKLSEFFTLDEVTASETAARRGLDNAPDDDTLRRLRLACAELDKVRQAIGSPIIVTSGYRSPAVNQAIGGSSKSWHLQGVAFDVIAPRWGSPLKLCQLVNGLRREGGLLLHEVIHEFGAWAHLAFAVDGAPRSRVLTIDKQGTRDGLLEVRR